MALPDKAAAIWAVATRITALDPNGYPATGLNTYTTDTLVKATATPVLSTGDDVEVKNAAGDLAAFGKHGDIIKYATMSIELATPDPALEQILAGGVLLSDTAVALGTPTGLTVTPQTTLGQLAAATYAYRATNYNAYGETTAQASVTGAVASGSTGANVISGVSIAAGALGARIYGRVQGSEQLIGSIPNIGTQATSAASGTGSPTSLAVTALTKSIPSGTKFQINGDTNTTKIVFTTTAFAPVGAVTVPVSVSQSITTTIAAGNIIPVFVDTGAVSPNGALPAADTTAGPGSYTGYQAPALGTVANQNGVSIELWSRAIVNGSQAATLPYYRTVYPKVANLHVGARDHTNANMQSVFEGQAYENPNWGSGPFGDWQFDSTKWSQRARCGTQVVPASSTTPVAAVL